MSDDFTLKINDSRLLDALARLEHFTGDMTPLMRAEAEHMQHAVEENFLQGGRPEWKPLRPATVKRREKLGHIPIAVLQETRALYNSIQSNAGRDFAVVGTNNPYAAIHNYGGTIHHKERRGEVELRTDRKGRLLEGNAFAGSAVFAKRSHKAKIGIEYLAAAHDVVMPARPFMKLTPADEQVMVDEAVRFVGKNLPA